MILLDIIVRGTPSGWEPSTETPPWKRKKPPLWKYIISLILTGAGIWLYGMITIVCFYGIASSQAVLFCTTLFIVATAGILKLIFWFIKIWQLS